MSQSRLLKVWQMMTLLLPTSCIRHWLGRGQWRHNIRLQDVTPLHEEILASRLQCLARCAEYDCRALQYQPLPPGGLRCETFGVSACVGLTGPEERLVPAPGVHYMDVSSDLDLSKRERQQAFWDDPGCREKGFCDPACAVTSKGDFCPGSDRYCTLIQSAMNYSCVGNTCQSPLWKINDTGVMLPKWQTWLADSHLAKLKAIVNDVCSLRFDLKIQSPGSISMTITSIDGHLANGRDFGKIAFVFEIGVNGNSQTVVKRRKQVNNKIQENILVTKHTPDILSTTDFRRYLLSWCNGRLHFGPEQQPGLVTSSYTEDSIISRLLLDISSGVEVAHLKMEKDVADDWLSQQAGISSDPTFVTTTNSLLLLQLPDYPVTSTTVKFDVKCNGNVWVVFRETLGPSRFHRLVLGADRPHSGLSRIEIIEGETIRHVATHTSSTVVVPSNAFNFFVVTYDSGAVTVLRDNIRLFGLNFPSPIPIRYVGVGGGCCSSKEFRLAKYDPAWRTDVWVMEGDGGYSNLAGLE